MKQSLALSIVLVYIGLIVGWILMIFATIYLRKSYNSIAKHTNVDLFKTTGTVYFIGAITLIVVIGAFILLIGKILEIVAFFSLPEEIPSASKGKKEATTKTERRCPNCDRVIPEDAVSCPYCSKKFEE